MFNKIKKKVMYIIFKLKKIKLKENFMEMEEEGEKFAKNVVTREKSEEKIDTIINEENQEARKILFRKAASRRVDERLKIKKEEDEEHRKK